MTGDYQAIIDAGKLISGPSLVPGGRSYVVIQQGGDRQAVHDLEHLLEQPSRIRAEVVTHTPQSFIDYFRTHYVESSAAIFANRDQFQITCILDYHNLANGAEWCTHRIVYTAPRSPEWKIWTGSNGIRMNQGDFSQFIEDNVIDIRTPPGAEVLEVARNLQAKKSVEFSSAIRLASGTQEFTYNETVSGTSAKGKLSIPETFTLGIPVFQGGQAYEVVARLRYRIDGGKLALWYDLYRPDVREAAAFAEITNRIATETNTEVWAGTVTTPMAPK